MNNECRCVFNLNVSQQIQACDFFLLGGRQKTALTMDDIRAVTKFVLGFAEQNALLLPGRIPGYKRFDIEILPSSKTKASIWRLYKDSAEVGLHTVGLSAFRKLWNQLLPFVIIGKPRLDVCWECQKNNSRIIR